MDGSIRVIKVGGAVIGDCGRCVRVCSLGDAIAMGCSGIEEPDTAVELCELLVILVRWVDFFSRPFFKCPVP